jgi:hypothetical protein
MYVFKPCNERPLPEDVEATESWIVEEDKHALYSMPLGATMVIEKLWYEIGSMLGLSHISNLYSDGIELSSSEDLSQLKEEVMELMRYWKSNILDERITVSDRKGKVDIKEHLQERASFLLEAIEIAVKDQGILLIC